MFCVWLGPPVCQAQSMGGSYVWSKTVNGVPTQSPVYSGGTASVPYGDGTTRTYNYSYSDSGDGSWVTPNVEAYFTPTTEKATALGAIAVAYKWDNGGNAANLPPPAVIVTETASDSASASSGTGTCDDNMGQTGAYVSATLYSAISNPGASIALGRSPTATATNVGSGHGGVFISYKTAVSPVTLSLGGVTNLLTAPTALTGQQLSGTLSVPSGFTVKSYAWSVTASGGSADVFKTYDFTLPSHQLVPLASADSTAAGFSFYDKKQETITIQCKATILAPDGTPLAVTAKSVPISVVKPTASWGVDPATVPTNGTQSPTGVGFHDDSATMQSYGVTTIWYPVKITVPSPFKGGLGGFAQIVTPTATIANASVTYSFKIKDASGKWVAPGTGLDQDFPYDFGYTVDASGNLTGQGPVPYTWPADGIGAAGDNPHGQEILTTGGPIWQTSSISDSFTTWLMYRPPPYGSNGTVWVPLMKSDWMVAADATGGPNNWVATKKTYNAPMPMDTADPPQWSKIITGQQYQP